MDVPHSKTAKCPKCYADVAIRLAVWWLVV